MTSKYPKDMAGRVYYPTSTSGSSIPYENPKFSSIVPNNDLEALTQRIAELEAWQATALDIIKDIYQVGFETEYSNNYIQVRVMNKVKNFLKEIKND